MKQEVKTKWLEALKSGKYKQGYGTLKTREDTHCCLGVLCDISGLGEWVDTSYEGAGETPNDGLLPNRVRTWAGLNNAYQAALANCNDRDDGSPDRRFSEDPNGYEHVISYIEENL